MNELKYQTRESLLTLRIVDVLNIIEVPSMETSKTWLDAKAAFRIR